MSSSSDELGQLGADWIRRPAGRYASNPRKLAELIGRAQRKASTHQGPLGDLKGELALLIRMLRAYARGAYPDLPWPTVLSSVGALLYFVTPVDLIPDFIAGAGLLDDAAVLAWAVRWMRSDLREFEAWEQRELDERIDEP
ncbi:MAG: YkvA family protein [Halofilum sp. (in: g-proteobacteria)]